MSLFDLREGIVLKTFVAMSLSFIEQLYACGLIMIDNRCIFQSFDRGRPDGA